MTRGALAALIERESDLKVVAEAEREDEILPMALAYRPDVAIIDTDRPTAGTLAAATQVREQLPSCQMLVLSTVWGQGGYDGLLAAVATGVLLKGSSADRLATVIRYVAAGYRVIDPHLPAAGQPRGRDPLTPREKTVLRLAAGGAEPAEIAADLHLSVGTVRNYLTAIVAKLQARNRVDAIVKARQAGWLP